jgi:hypothetical protein
VLLGGKRGRDWLVRGEIKRGLEEKKQHTGEAPDGTCNQSSIDGVHIPKKERPINIYETRGERSRAQGERPVHSKLVIE